MALVLRSRVKDSADVFGALSGWKHGNTGQKGGRSGTRFAWPANCRPGQVSSLKPGLVLPHPAT